MAVVFLQTPPTFAAAFNEIPLVVQTPKARYDQLTQDLDKATTVAERTQIQNEMNALNAVKNQDTLDPMEFVAVIGTGGAMNRSVTITPEVGPDGKAYVDLSYIMRRAFVDVTVEGTRGFTQRDSNLLAQGYIDENGTEVASFYAINAVGQPGYYNINKGFAEYSKLTGTPLIRYHGYPFFASFRASAAAPDTVFSLMNNGNHVFSGLIMYPVGNIVLAVDAPIVSHINISGGAEESYTISEGCVPAEPFYVRWINTSGGWDSWMFERRDEAYEVEDVSNIQLHIADSTDTQATVSLSAAQTVTVGEGLLSKDDYRTLAALPRSPRIQWYNEELQTWQTIVIAESFSSSWNSRSGFGNVEFTFALPRILTQF